MPTTPTNFSGINSTLDISPNTTPITINDVLVRALTGNGQLQTSNTAISFSDLAGKIGVGGFIGAVSNSQGSFIKPVTSSTTLQFHTDVYNPQISWTHASVSGPAVNATPSGNTILLTLTQSAVGNAVSNVAVTANLAYQGIVIGSNTTYVNLSASVFNPALVLSLSPVNGVASQIGYSAQTASINVTASSNVPGGVITWSASPNDAGVSVSGNTIVVTSTAKAVGITNATNYVLSANVYTSSGIYLTSSNTFANVSSTMYGNGFSLMVPANTVASSNVGPVNASMTLTASSNAPGSVIVWTLSNIVGGSLTPSVSGNTPSSTFTVTLPAVAAGLYGSNTATATVTASMYSNSSLASLVSTRSANVSLAGIAYGLNYSPAANAALTGYVAQTAVSTAAASYQAGTFAWSYANTTGSGSVSLNNGSANSANATWTVTQTQSAIGSSASIYSVNPTISFNGKVVVNVAGSLVSTSATVQQASIVLSAPASSNAQYANSGPVTTSMVVTATGTPPQSNIAWTATSVSGVATTLIPASDNQSANLYFTIPTGTFVFANSIYTVTANCYNTSTMQSIASNSVTISLIAGAYGLNASFPTNGSTILSSGYTAQTASISASASVQVGTVNWNYALSSGSNPQIAISGLANNSTITFTKTTSSVLTNTAVELYNAYVVDPYSRTVYTTATPSFTITAQQNAYTFSLSGAATNTQILSNTTSNVVTLITGNHNITGGTVAWSTSNTVSGYQLAGNTSAVTVGYSGVANASAPIIYYTTNLNGSLHDASGRLVQTLTQPITLRSYFPNVTISAASNSVNGYSAQTVSGSALITCWPGANTLATNQTVVAGTGFTYTNGTQNTSYYALNYSLTASAVGTVTGTANIQPVITFYEATSANVAYSADPSLTASYYNPAFSLSPVNGSVAGWTSAQTAYAVVTATSNVASASYTWDTLTMSSGNFSGAYTQGTGNNQYVGYVSISAVGGYAAVASSVRCNVYDSASRYVTSVTSGSFSATAIKYNPALVITGPTSNSQSNTFTGRASITLTASANASIPSPSYVCTATSVSGNAAVSITGSNSVCTLNTTGVGTTNNATYNVTFSVYTAGTLLQSATQQISLSATGVVPAYALSVSNNAVAGFNFAQTSSTTCSVSNLGSGYAVWGMYGVSGTTPTWSTPGGANSYISTSISQGSVGAASSVVYQTCACYSPDGILMRQLTSPDYSMAATVYNPTLSMATSNASVSTTTTTATAIATAQLYANSGATSAGATFTMSAGAVSGAGTAATNGTGGGQLNVTTSTTGASGSVVMTGSLVLNSQTIAGPINSTISAYASAAPYTSVSASVSPTSVTSTYANNSYNAPSSAQITTPSATITASGGNTALAYSWTRTSGSSAFVASSPSSATTAFYATVGQNQSASATFTGTATDGSTSASGSTSTSVTYTDTYFTPVQHTYTSGSGTEIAPTGATSVIIAVWGGGGSSSGASWNSVPGGSGGYSQSSMAISGGQTLAYTVGAGGAYASSNKTGLSGGTSSVSAGTATISAMSDAGGGGGFGAVTDSPTGGAGGSATGGTVTNTTGNAGADVNGGAAGAAIVGWNSNSGGVGGSASGSSSAGSSGKVIFYYT